MLKTRILTALVLVPLVLAALFMLPPRGFGVAALAVVFLAAREWSRLAGFPVWNAWIFAAFILLAGAALLFLPAWGFGRGWPDAIVLAVCGTSALFWLVVAPLWVGLRWPTSTVWAMLAAGWIVLIGAWVALVELQARSPWLVLAAMAIVWIADTAAYFSGRAFGRRKLAPQISPGKTWEGVIGAFVAVLIYASVASFVLQPSANIYDRLVTLIAVAALTVLSMTGDLFESWIKRGAGAKDSGSLLPGHGGVLDRIDSLTAALPFAALYLARFLPLPGST